MACITESMRLVADLHSKPRFRLKLVLLATCLAPFAPFCSAADYGEVTMSKVADGVFLFTTSPYGDVGFGGNSVAIITGEGVVVFDTSGTPASGQAILSEVRKLTDKPVLYVINSHWHWDHWAATRFLRPRSPTCNFCRTPRTASR